MANVKQDLHLFLYSDNNHRNRATTMSSSFTLETRRHPQLSIGPKVSHRLHEKKTGNVIKANTAHMLILFII